MIIARPKPDEVVVAHLPITEQLIVHHPDGRQSEHRWKALLDEDPSPSRVWWVVYPAQRGGSPWVQQGGTRSGKFVVSGHHHLDKPVWLALTRAMKARGGGVAYVVRETQPYFTRTRLATIGYRWHVEVEDET